MKWYALAVFFLTRISVLGQDACTIARGTESLNGKEIKITAKLVIRGHNIAFIPSNENANYSGVCMVFPLLPGIPAFQTRGVVIDEQAERVVPTWQKYLDHLRQGGEDWCFEARGVVKIARPFSYDPSRGGNGFGFKGALQSALLVSELKSLPCK